MATVFREGNVAISLEGDLERVSLEAVDRLLPKVREHLEKEVGFVLTDGILPEWPIKSGLSRGSFEKMTTLTPDSLAVELRNAVPYVYYVRPKEWFGAETAWSRLVRKPMRQIAREFAARFGRQILDQALKRSGS